MLYATYEIVLNLWHKDFRLQHRHGQLLLVRAFEMDFAVFCINLFPEVDLVYSMTPVTRTPDNSKPR